MASTESFAVFDCTLARCATGRSCSNLRELLDAVRTVPGAVLEHHMMRCALDDHFELFEFPNDLARWCWDALGDHVLAEQLGLVDPYQQASTAALRSVLADMLEEHIWKLDRVPSCRSGLDLHLISSRLLAHDTSERLTTSAALAEALPRISRRSFFFHVHEARRRTGNKTDDFSAWLEELGADAALVAKLRSIDFYFLNLKQLRREFVDAFCQHLPEPQVVVRVTG